MDSEKRLGEENGRAKSPANNSKNPSKKEADTMKDARNHHITVLGIVAIVAIVAIVLTIVKFDTSDAGNLVGYAGQPASDLEEEQLKNFPPAVSATPIPSIDISTPEKATLGLLRLINLYNNAPSPALESKLKDVAEKRKQMLLSLIEENPAAVLKAAVPLNSRGNLPPEIQNNVEEQVNIEGELQVQHSDDFERGISKFYYFILDNSNRRHTLHFAGDKPELMSKSRIKVKGVRLNNEVAVQNDGLTVLYEAQTGHTVKKVAVLLFNWQNDQRQHVTTSQAKTTVFTLINDYYKENSFNQLSLEGKYDLTGDVFGWLTIPYDNTNCGSNYWVWSNAARQEVQNQGINLSGYDNFVYAFPSISCGGWAGLGELWGDEVWINGNFNLRVIGHEFGHNFGVHHASSYSCYDTNNARVSISTNCIASEYGDPFDIMGSASQYHMNNFQKVRLNWLSAGNKLTTNANGTYTIQPIERSSAGIQALQLPRGTDYYYLEYRRPYGFDNFAATDPVVNGVSIRLNVDYYSATQTKLIDTTPSTTSFFDSSLLVGKTFIDPAKNIFIRTISADNSSATVQLFFGPAPCFRSNPTVTITPSTQWAFAGETKTYTVTIKNNDDTGCSPSTFIINSILPSYLTQNPQTINVILANGSTANVPINVSSSSATPEGFYQFTETATNAQFPSYTSQAGANYNLQIQDTIPPIVTLTSPQNGGTVPRKGNLKISASASDASGISRIDLKFDNNIVNSCYGVTSCSASVRTNTIPKGLHTVTASAVDNAPAPNTATVSVTVTK